MDKQKIAEFFDRISPNWDSGLNTDAKKVNKILNAAGISTGCTVLDVACGTGVMFPFYLERGAKQITGIDISQGMLNEAEAKFGGKPEIELLYGDAEEYEFSRAYDRCMVFNAFPHFENPEALLKNLVSSLKSGGTLTVAHDWGKAALDAHHKNEAGEVSRGLMDENDLAELFGKIGLSKIYKYADDGIYIVSGKKASP